MNAADIKSAATHRVRDLALTLFPAAKQSGNVLSVGSLSGEPGSSLKINISGRHAGLWRDWASGDERSHGLIDLVMQAKNIPYKEALVWLSEFTGIPLVTSTGPRPRQWTKPATSRLIELPESEAISAWLTERKLSIPIASQYGVFATEDHRCCVMLHYNNEEPCLVKAFYHPSLNKPQPCYTNSNPLHVLFGKAMVTPDTPSALPTGTLAITEGQWDALSLATIGIPAVSIPSGVDNLDWIDNDWEYLCQWTNFLLCFDMDPPGRRCAQKVAERLGLDKCRTPVLPLKDANDMLKADRVPELIRCLQNPSEFEVATMQGAAVYRDEVFSAVQVNQRLDGLPFLWNDFPLRIRPHQTTVWTGYTSHGKSTVLQQLLTFLIGLGDPCAIASLEAKPTVTLAAMARQIAGDFDIKDLNVFDHFYSHIASMVDIYTSTKRADIHAVLRDFREMFHRHGTKQFAIDNAMCLQTDRSDLDAQSEASDAIRLFSQEIPAHVHLVVHPRKPPGGGGHPKAPNNHDVRGASEWGDMAFNIIAVWRNLQKLDDIQAALDDGNMDTAQMIRTTVADGKIIVGKQRETGDLPQTSYFFDNHSRRICLTYNELQHPYVSTTGMHPTALNCIIRRA